MTELVPTIMVKTIEEYKAVWAKYYPFARRIQVDIAEEGFAAEPSLSLDNILAGGGWPTDRLVDLHIMSADPLKYVNPLLQKRPNLVIFHVESGQDLMSISAPLKEAGIKIGVAFLKATYPKDYEALLKAMDHALIFNGNRETLGTHSVSGGGLLLLEKVGLIKSINPEIEIGWDGGVVLENIHQIAVSGVNVINAGGAILNAADPKAAFDELVTEMNRPGVV